MSTADIKAATPSIYDALTRALEKAVKVYESLPTDNHVWINCPKHGAFLVSREALAEARRSPCKDDLDTHYYASRIACRDPKDAEALSDFLHSAPRVFHEIAEKLPEAARAMRLLLDQSKRSDAMINDLKRRLAMFELAFRLAREATEESA